MRILTIYTFTLFLSFASFAQKERGKMVVAPKIPQGKSTTTETKPKEKQEFDFIFEEEPKLRFSNQFENSNLNKKAGSATTTTETSNGIRIEPLREINRLVEEDTSSIDEGELLIVEIEEDAKFQGSDKMVGIAAYL